ncbi:MAG: aminotransferase class I/II-fold pyridoxal phosphate-dependent enzyme [Anaerovoracaceae bacterium]
MQYKSLTDFLSEYAEKRAVSFHMPGHKDGAAFRRFPTADGQGRNEAELFLGNVFRYDITEIPGADNLQEPETVIRDMAERYSALYGSEKTFLLINGSSCGLAAAIDTAVPPGGTIIMARNCHKSIYNEVRRRRLRVEYAYPEVSSDLETTEEITAAEIKRCFDEAPSASAVILPSPDYYGMLSDIGAIAGEVHRHGAVLIVDQAHGAHLKFFDRYAPFTDGSGRQRCAAAEDLGADIVINSTHKTLASFTQTGIANVCSDRVDSGAFEEHLLAHESTSPSYLLMTSLYLDLRILEEHAGEAVRSWRSDIDFFREKAKAVKSLRLRSGQYFDDTKILLDMSAAGYDGAALERELEKRDIIPELSAGDIVMCMTGIGNVRSDYERLLEALSDIEESAGGTGLAADGSGGAERKAAAAAFMEKRSGGPAVIPEEIGSSESVSLDEAAGRISAGSIVPYPPGIPVICPGELISREMAEYIKNTAAGGTQVLGLTRDGKIKVSM